VRVRDEVVDEEGVGRIDLTAQDIRRGPTDRVSGCAEFFGVRDEFAVLLAEWLSDGRNRLTPPDAVAFSRREGRNSPLW
jgi:hypothetical protein